ncbi:hypothetical protein [Actinokineospora pegani]|uniref:hypothetical protein n=1 Tax=Actinokineospora pegani TaxID=2654637 RepID=UPI0012EAE592|nr:hypothetical protein [Actinokineospora pegani]
MTDDQGRFRDRARDLRGRLREVEADPGLPLDEVVDGVAELVSAALDHVHAVITAAASVDAPAPSARRPAARPRDPEPEARPATVRNIVSGGHHGSIIQAGQIHGSVHYNDSGR